MYSITTFLVGLDEKGEKCVGAKLSEGNRQTAPGPNYSILYLASSKGLTLCNVQGVFFTGSTLYVFEMAKSLPKK